MLGEKLASIQMHVLEAARMRAPVKNVNVILSEEKELTIKGRSSKCSLLELWPLPALVLPVLTRMCLTSLINSIPNVIIQNVLNFNHVGFNPVGAGTRQCPGRNIAMKFASDLLIESRKKQRRESYVPPMN